MNTKHQFIRHTRLLHNMAWIAFLFASCVSAKTINESPTRFGYGFEIAPGLQLGESSSAVHALLGYSRIGYKGGGGHNNIFQAGGQFRHALSDQAPEGFWIGGELTFLRISNVSDGSDSKSAAPGLTVGGLAGYRFLAGKIPVSVYFAPAYLKRGKFRMDGNTSGMGSSGFYARLGLDFHLFSLMHKKGR